MNSMYADGNIIGSDTVKISNSGECSVINIKNGTGYGKMTVYSFYDAVNVSFNDFHLNECKSNFTPSCATLSIEHCREGRIEWDNGDGGFIYIEAGDIMISSHKIGSNDRQFSFPINHYHGLTIAFDVKKTKQLLPTLLGGFSADIERISQRYCGENGFFVMRADKATEHIFSELYNLPPKIRTDYCKIKMLELLLFLDSADIPSELTSRKYYGKANVNKVKKMSALMTKNLQKHYTINELSSLFDFSPTSMKKCFKAVFGQSVYSYMKSFRMNSAAVMLRNSRQSILEIAGVVGYDNPGKFAAAFKDVIGSTPSEFRKNVSEWISQNE